MQDLQEIKAFLKAELSKHAPDLQLKDKPDGFEAKGTKEVMQGKQKVKGHYFASVVEKPKDIRFYFFPIYTHAAEFSLSAENKKALKGKSCFHFKKLSNAQQADLAEMIAKGVDLYKKDGLI